MTTACCVLVANLAGGPTLGVTGGVQHAQPRPGQVRCVLHHFGAPPRTAKLELAAAQQGQVAWRQCAHALNSRGWVLPKLG
eukprot:scaffold26444_cov18-Tisochrysis_lutea.AAC.1